MSDLHAGMQALKRKKYFAHIFELLKQKVNSDLQYAITKIMIGKQMKVFIL
jgi:hypothetical protein